MDQCDLLPALLCDGGLDKTSSLRMDAMSLSLGIRVKLDVIVIGPEETEQFISDAVDEFGSKSGVDCRLANVTRTCGHQIFR